MRQFSPTEFYLRLLLHPMLIWTLFAVQSIYPKTERSQARQYLGWIVIISIILFLPLIFYQRFKSLKEAQTNPDITQSIRDKDRSDSIKGFLLWGSLFGLNIYLYYPLATSFYILNTVSLFVFLFFIFFFRYKNIKT